MSANPNAIKTSVVIPVYNTREYLPACLDSVLAQTQADIEVILVDDGSTDGSLDIEYAYAGGDSRIRVIEQANLRQGTARNRGLASARGEFVYFMDSDDLILPTLFQTCYDACQQDDLDFATFDTAGFVDDPNVECAERFGEVRDRSRDVAPDITDGVSFWTTYGTSNAPWVCWLQYFRRDFLIKNGLQFVEGIYFEDNDWILRVYLAAQRMRYIPLKLHRYRERPGSNVHSGFSEALAWSCFDVYGILVKLLESQRTPERISMAEDSIRIMTQRFQSFDELPPNQELTRRSLEFADSLREACEDDELALPLRKVHFQTLLKVEDGLARWLRCTRTVPRRIVIDCLLDGLPEIEADMRVGLYGTGKACSAFLKVWGTAGRDIVFIDTDPDEGQMFADQRVVSIEEAARENLDAIIITSEKYQGPMRQNISRWFSGTVPVYVVPRSILAFADLSPSIEVG